MKKNSITHFCKNKVFLSTKKYYTCLKINKYIHQRKTKLYLPTVPVNKLDILKVIFIYFNGIRTIAYLVQYHIFLHVKIFISIECIYIMQQKCKQQ